MTNIGADSQCKATAFLLTAGGDRSGRHSASGVNVFSSSYFTLCTPCEQLVRSSTLLYRVRWWHSGYTITGRNAGDAALASTDGGPVSVLV